MVKISYDLTLEIRNNKESYSKNNDDSLCDFYSLDNRCKSIKDMFESLLCKEIKRYRYDIIGCEQEETFSGKAFNVWLFDFETFFGKTLKSDELFLSFSSMSSFTKSIYVVSVAYYAMPSFSPNYFNLEMIFFLKDFWF